MTRATLAALALVIAFSGASSAPSAETVASSPAVRFRALDVFVDAPVPVAAFQVEVEVRAGDSSIVGVEGGESPFEEPPYYDPAALSHGRIILAAFNTRATLPAGRHRAATLHVREAGPEAEYEIDLAVAADIDGTRISAEAYLEARKEDQ